MGLGLAVLRAIVGLLFVGHGAQKLFGWFGGGGPEGTGRFFESVGVRPGKQNAVASGISETAGGALLALGLATPLASAALSGTMATALWTVHKDKGPWATAGGYEYNLTLLAVLFALADLDPGSGRSTRHSKSTTAAPGGRWPSSPPGSRGRRWC